MFLKVFWDSDLVPDMYVLDSISQETIQTNHAHSSAQHEVEKIIWKVQMKNDKALD